MEMMDDSLLVRQEKQYASCPLQLLLRGLNSISPSLASFSITKSIHAQPKELEEGGLRCWPGHGSTVVVSMARCREASQGARHVQLQPRSGS